MVNRAVEVDALVVVRGSSTVLPGLWFTVPAGQVTGLLGPSGCGKSTLMRAVVGVQKVRSGSVTVLGEPAGSRQLRDRARKSAVSGKSVSVRVGFGGRRIIKKKQLN